MTIRAIVRPIVRAIVRGIVAGDDGFDIGSIFAASDDGLALDFGNWSRLATDTAGTTPVTDYGQLVAYAADLSGKGNPVVQATATAQPYSSGVPRELGTELVTNGDFAADANWTKGTGWTIGSGVATKTAGSASLLSQAVTLVAGKHYQLSAQITRTAGTLTARVTGGTTVTDAASSGARAFTWIFVAQAGNTTLEFSADATFAGTVDKVTLKEVTAFTNRCVRWIGAGNLKTAGNVDLSVANSAGLCAAMRRGSASGNHTLVDVGNYTPGATDGSFRMDIPSNLAQLRVGANIPTAIPEASEQATATLGPTENLYTIEIDRDGAAVADQVKVRNRGFLSTNTTSGVAVTAGALASGPVTVNAANNNTRTLAALYRRVVLRSRKFSTDETAIVEGWANEGGVIGAVLGDSCFASCKVSSGQAKDCFPVHAFIGGFVANGAAIALAGDRIADQSADWAALAGKAAIEVVIVGIGQNDCKGRVGENTATAADVIADYQALVDDIRADCPDAYIVLCALTPSGVWMDGATNPAAAKAARVSLNQAIAGGGATPITGADAYVDSYNTTLDDGSGNLLAVYDLDGTGVHQNHAARFIMATAIRAELESAALLEGAE